MKMPENLITFDFETYYADDYSLSKLTTEAYINSPSFQVIGCGVKYGSEPAEWIPGGASFPLRFTQWMHDHHVAKCLAVAHNSYFDAAIAKWHFHINPKLWLDTRTLGNIFARPFTRSMSLANLLNFYGYKAKGTFLASAKNMRLIEFSDEFMQQMATYCLNDVEGCYKLLATWIDDIKPIDLVIQDRILRMFVDYQLKLDAGVLQKHLVEVVATKEKQLAAAAQLGFTGTVLRSNPKFAAAMEDIGYGPVPTKISPTTDMETFALAKGDPEFLEWQEDFDDDPLFNALIEARLGQKSSQAETRAARLLDMAGRTGVASAGYLPVPILFYGAHTSRKSGMDKINLQNLKRGSELRNAIIAPPGHVVLSADQGQIECRINAKCAAQNDMVDRFAMNLDEYCEFASTVYGQVITKADYEERFVGKVGVLSLGYGAAWRRFQIMLRGYGRKASDEFCQRVVAGYRAKYSEIVRLWRNLDYAIQCMASGADLELWYGHTKKDRFVLNCGITLYYNNLRNEDGDWKYDYAGATKKLYGAKMTENVVQAMAARLLDEQMIVLAANNVVSAMVVHDEMVFVIPEDEVDATSGLINDVMTNPPLWLADLPLSVEIGVGPSYGQAK